MQPHYVTTRAAAGKHAAEVIKIEHTGEMSWQISKVWFKVFDHSEAVTFTGSDKKFSSEWTNCILRNGSVTDMWLTSAPTKLHTHTHTHQNNEVYLNNAPANGQARPLHMSWYESTWLLGPLTQDQLVNKGGCQTTHINGFQDVQTVHILVRLASRFCSMRECFKRVVRTMGHLTLLK